MRRHQGDIILGSQFRGPSDAPHRAQTNIELKHRQLEHSLPTADLLPSAIPHRSVSRATEPNTPPSAPSSISPPFSLGAEVAETLPGLGGPQLYYSCTLLPSSSSSLFALTRGVTPADHLTLAQPVALTQRPRLSGTVAFAGGLTSLNGRAFRRTRC